MRCTVHHDGRPRRHRGRVRRERDDEQRAAARARRAATRPHALLRSTPFWMVAGVYGSTCERERAARRANLFVHRARARSEMLERSLLRTCPSPPPAPPSLARARSAALARYIALSGRRGQLDRLHLGARVDPHAASTPPRTAVKLVGVTAVNMSAGIAKARALRSLARIFSLSPNFPETDARARVIGTPRAAAQDAAFARMFGAAGAPPRRRCRGSRSPSSRCATCSPSARRSRCPRSSRRRSSARARWSPRARTSRAAAQPDRHAVRVHADPPVCAQRATCPARAPAEHARSVGGLLPGALGARMARSARRTARAARSTRRCSTAAATGRCSARRGAPEPTPEQSSSSARARSRSTARPTASAATPARAARPDRAARTLRRHATSHFGYYPNLTRGSRPRPGPDPTRGTGRPACARPALNALAARRFATARPPLELLLSVGVSEGHAPAGSCRPHGPLRVRVIEVGSVTAKGCRRPVRVLVRVVRQSFVAESPFKVSRRPSARRSARPQRCAAVAPRHLVC